AHKLLSLGVVDGRNIWRTDLAAALDSIRPVMEKRSGPLWLAPSCSLLHVPASLKPEDSLDEELKSWMAFAQEKLDELKTLKQALTAPDEASDQALQASAAASAARRNSPHLHN